MQCRANRVALLKKSAISLIRGRTGKEKGNENDADFVDGGFFSLSS